mmetsp:Transcript_41402/g.53423  ORF Transcript_41402/g.53423 Transcript_41402/m.53423 type:complete len:561 (-) Transcript_41402:692-2374(-)
MSLPDIQNKVSEETRPTSLLLAKNKPGDEVVCAMKDMLVRFPWKIVKSNKFEGRYFFYNTETSKSLWSFNELEASMFIVQRNLSNSIDQKEIKKIDDGVFGLKLPSTKTSTTSSFLGNNIISNCNTSISSSFSTDDGDNNDDDYEDWWNHRSSASTIDDEENRRSSSTSTNNNDNDNNIQTTSLSLMMDDSTENNGPEENKEEVEDRSTVLTARSATAPLSSSRKASLSGPSGGGGGPNSSRTHSARSSNSNWSTPPGSARNSARSSGYHNFRPQSAEKQRWLRRLQVLEHPNMIKVNSQDSNQADQSPSITDKPSSSSSHLSMNNNNNLKASDRAIRIAKADEDCQRALHSQEVAPRQWRSMHQHYHEAMSQLEAPESPLLQITNLNSPPMIEGGVWGADGSMDLGATPKAFFLEPMAWMDLDDFKKGIKKEGPLSCPGCQCELGSYQWEEEHHQSGSSSNQALPRLIVMRRYVCANALPSEVNSSHDSTPRDSNDNGIPRSRSDTSILPMGNGEMTTHHLNESDSEAKMLSPAGLRKTNLELKKADDDDDEAPSMDDS